MNEFQKKKDMATVWLQIKCIPNIILRVSDVRLKIECKSVIKMIQSNSVNIIFGLFRRDK